MKDHQKELTELAADGSPEATFQALDAYRDLAGKAPDDIAPDWARVVDRIEQLQSALDAADVSPDAYEGKQWKDGLSTEQRDEIARAASGLADPRTAEALARVQQQARDVCHTPLSL